MKKIVSIVLAAALALPGAAASAKNRKTNIGHEPVQVKRALFSGSESHIHNFLGLYADCTSTTADVRIVKPPTKGEIRFEESRQTFFPGDAPFRRACAGKPIDTVRMYYKANDKAEGKDTFLLDVDTKLGAVKRYAFTVDIR
jgi:hypothetical protein